MNVLLDFGAYTGDSLSVLNVLEKLVRHPVCGRVKHLLVEWHNNRLEPRWPYRLRRRLLEFRYRLNWGKRDFPELGNIRARGLAIVSGRRS